MKNCCGCLPGISFISGIKHAPLRNLRIIFLAANVTCMRANDPAILIFGLVKCASYKEMWTCMDPYTIAFYLA